MWHRRVGQLAIRGIPRYPARMNFVDLKALMASGRQCGVVVFAAGLVHGFTMPETIAVAAVMGATGLALIILSSIKPRRKK